MPRAISPERARIGLAVARKGGRLDVRVEYREDDFGSEDERIYVGGRIVAERCLGTRDDGWPELEWVDSHAEAAADDRAALLREALRILLEMPEPEPVLPVSFPAPPRLVCSPLEGPMATNAPNAAPVAARALTLPLL